MDVGREAHLHVLGPLFALGVQAKGARLARVGLPEERLERLVREDVGDLCI